MISKEERLREKGRNTPSSTAKTPEYLEKENDALTDLLKKALAEITELKERLSFYEKPMAGYDKDWEWITKIVFVIDTAGKPLRSREIIALLQTREPVLEEKASKEKFISAFLNVAKRNKRLFTYKVAGVRGNYYCLPEWMDDMSQLMEDKKQQIDWYVLTIDRDRF